MRDEVGVLIGLTYSSIQITLLNRWAAFLTSVLHSSHRPDSISLKQMSMRPSCFPALGLLGRELMVWKHETANLKPVPQTPANRNSFKLISP